MIAKFIATFIMLVGLVSAVVPKIPGLLIISIGILVYWVISGLKFVQPWVYVTLVLLLIVGEVGGRGLRIYLTKNYNITRLYSTNTTAGNIAGILAADALLGPIWGIIVWELIAGKSWLPRFDIIGRILLRLSAVALFRFSCGLVMIMLVIIYMFD